LSFVGLDLLSFSQLTVPFAKRVVARWPITYKYTQLPLLVVCIFTIVASGIGVDERSAFFVKAEKIALLFIVKQQIAKNTYISKPCPSPKMGGSLTVSSKVL
jgi:hypothetical protein